MPAVGLATCTRNLIRKRGPQVPPGPGAPATRRWCRHPASHVIPTASAKRPSLLLTADSSPLSPPSPRPLAPSQPPAASTAAAGVMRPTPPCAAAAVAVAAARLDAAAASRAGQHRRCCCCRRRCCRCSSLTPPLPLPLAADCWPLLLAAAAGAGARRLAAHPVR